LSKPRVAERSLVAVRRSQYAARRRQSEVDGLFRDIEAAGDLFGRLPLQQQIETNPLFFREARPARKII
jgi:hypothetical protein